MTKIGTFYVFWCFIVCSLFYSDPLLLFTGVHLPWFVFSAVEGFVIKVLIKKFKKELIHFLDHMILKVQNGKSFRESYVDSLGGCSKIFKSKMETFFKTVTFTQQKKVYLMQNFENFLLHHLKIIDNEGVFAVSRLKKLRYLLKAEEKFRRKSGKASIQLRLQSLILAILYIVLSIYQISIFGFSDIREIFCVSLIMFVFGLILTQVIGKKRKWRV